MSLMRIMRDMRPQRLGIIARSLIITAGLLISQATFLAPLAHAAVDTCTWTGLGADANWNTTGNWNCSIDGASAVPENDDTLVFPSGSARLTNVNDIVGLDLDHITISGDGYTITGNAVTLSPSSSVLLQITGNTNDFGIDTTLVGGSSKSINSSGSANTISGDMDLALTGSADMNVGASASNTLTITGVISGSTDGFIVSNGGTVAYDSISTFTAGGVLQINGDSTVSCGEADCLGVAGNDLYMYGSARLELDTTSDFQNDIFLNTGTGDPTVQATLTGATLTGTTTLVDTDAVIGADASVAFIANGSVVLGSNTVTYTGGSGAQIIHNGVISGAGNVIIDSYVQMVNNNSYTGETIVNSGAVLIASAANAMGTTAGDTTIEDGGTLMFELSGNTTIPENITVSGTGYYDGAIENFDDTDTATLSGTITLDGNTTVANSLAGSGGINLSGSITGTGDLTFVGDSGITGTGFRFSGSSANDYVGTTYLDAANLHLSKDADVQAIPGDVVATAVPAHTAYLTVESNEQIADDATITIDSDASVGGLVITGGNIETVGTIEGDGLIDIGSATDFLQVGGGDVSGTFNGQVLGPDDGVIFKVGSGTWDFQGSNDTDFSTAVSYQVNDGKLLANASDTSLSVSGFWVAGTNAVLGGSGEIGPLTVTTGTVAPGNSPGCLYPAGDVSFASGTHFAVQLNGSVVCTGYDRLSASGAVTLNNPTLDVSLGYAPTVGTVYEIATGSSVTGQFAGLADDATFVVGGNTLRINYTATGVTLAVVKAATSGSLGVTGTNMLVGLPVAMLLSSAAGIAIVRRRKLAHYRVR